jgi:hypothetical protein
LGGETSLPVAQEFSWLFNLLHYRDLVQADVFPEKENDKGKIQNRLSSRFGVCLSFFDRSNCFGDMVLPGRAIEWNTSGVVFEYCPSVLYF